MRKWLTLVGMLILCWCSLKSAAQEYSASHFFSGFKSPALALSPNGNRLLALHLDDKSQRYGLVVGNLNTDEINWAHLEKDYSITSAGWATTDRIVYQIRAGLFSVHPDGGRVVELIKPHTCYNQIIQLPLDGSSEMLVEKGFVPDDHGIFETDVYRINVYTGRSRKVVSNRLNAHRWLADRAGVVRVAEAVRDDKCQVWHRPTEDSKWDLLGEYSVNDDDITPLAFGDDPGLLYVSARGGRDESSIFSYDLRTKALQTNLFSVAGYDVDDVRLSRSGRYLGVPYEDDRPRAHWVQPELKAAQQAADEKFPGHANTLIAWTASFDKVILLSYSDRAPGTYYLHTAKSGAFRPIWKIGRHIVPDRMAATKSIRYRARDGLDIHGYLTLPNGAGADPLPLIVMPHGGPMSRDSWGFDPELQFLASCGYAVLQMNFRGSTGYGKSFFNAGNKQWGRAMQDDISDGVRWAISQGIADPKRVGIFGFSYGGYAALLGLQTTPELYQCGISAVAPVDLVTTFRAFRPPDRYLGAWLTGYRGDPRKDKELLASVSPINHVDKLQTPVLLAWGALDDRIPVSTARKYIALLKKKGKDFNSTIYQGEGHNQWDDSNEIDFHNDVAAFLEKHMPAKKLAEHPPTNAPATSQ